MSAGSCAWKLANADACGRRADAQDDAEPGAVAQEDLRGVRRAVGVEGHAAPPRVAGGRFIGPGPVLRAVRVLRCADMDRDPPVDPALRAGSVADGHRS